ncbi:MAG: YfiR family protein [Gammaproteobacteria bacterium]|nr:YfiR family protein [Gammaproteobacteria bacterium]MBQ0839938.1 YfiR family protein [Gammaproteobacteria bacterium]
MATPSCFAASFSDHQIKAAFIFNFANFVRWPKEAFAGDGSPFVICASNAQSPTIKTLAEVVEDESINSHKLIVKAPFDPTELSDCHILFLEKADIADYQTQLAKLSTGKLLTVSDTRNFVDKGGLIQLTLNKARIQPTINTIQVERSQLKVSSTLLRLANIYRSPAEGDK